MLRGQFVLRSEKKERKKEKRKKGRKKTFQRSRSRWKAITNPHAVSRLKWVKLINVNKSIGQLDGVSKTITGERQNAAYDLGLLFAKACVSNYLD